MSVLGGVIAPGFFSNPIVQTALVVGGVVAVVSGLVGVFTVIRGQSFTTEAISDVGATGGSGAYLVGVSALAGFVAAAVVSAGVIEMIGLRRPRGRDIATGIVLGAALGFAALFLYFDTTHTSTTGASITILFGSIFVISSSVVPTIVGLSALVLAIVVVFYRRLLLTALDSDLAAARGVSARWVGLGYLLALSLSVALSAITIGAVLGVALVVGPAATALHLTKRPGFAFALSGLIGLVAVWVGILLAYDSYYWPPVGRGWPVSFLVVALIFSFYVSVHVATQHAFKKKRHIETDDGESGPVCH